MSADRAETLPVPLGHSCVRGKQLTRRGRVAWAGFVLVCVMVPVVWGSNLLIPYQVPTESMQPAIMAGDRIVSERFTFKTRPPRRGDIVVFKNDFTAALPDHCYCCKRVAGEPGEHLRIADGKLYVNGVPTALTNQSGSITYAMPPMFSGNAQVTDVLVPAGEYFVLGDNSTNSEDSRFFGFVPANRILGRVSFCFWPLTRFGGVK